MKVRKLEYKGKEYDFALNHDAIENIEEKTGKSFAGMMMLDQEEGETKAEFEKRSAKHIGNELTMRKFFNAVVWAGTSGTLQYETFRKECSLLEMMEMLPVVLMAVMDEIGANLPADPKEKKGAAKEKK